MAMQHIFFLSRASCDTQGINKKQQTQQKANLEHVLASCRSSLADGKSRWWHDQILTQLAAGVEQARKKLKQLSKGSCFIHFHMAGESAAAETRSKGVLATASDWLMRVDLRKQLKFPEEITHTCLRPDIVLWSKGTKQVVLIELTVPWEERMEEAHERKLKKYQALILESRTEWMESLEPSSWSRLQGLCRAVTLESVWTAQVWRAS